MITDRLGRRHSQAGIALVELLLAIALVGIISVPVTAWAALVLTRQDDARSELDRVNAMGRLNAYVARDVASASQVKSVGGTDCTGGGGGGTSGVVKLQLIPSGADRRVVYKEANPSSPLAGTRSLWRRECDPAGALRSAVEVVRGILPSSTAVTCPQLGGAVVSDPCTSDPNKQLQLQVTPLDADLHAARVMQIVAMRRTSSVSTGSPSVSNRRPVAQITTSPVSGYAPTIFRISGTDSFDSDGTISSYNWTFPPGATCSPSNGGAVQTCTFSGTGDQLIQLQVTDNGGATNAGAATVTILNRFPIASATVSPSTGKVGSTAFTLDASASVDPDGGPLTYRWDLGEDQGAGRYLTGVRPTFTYPSGTAAGLRQVTLVVTDAAGDNDAYVVALQVDPADGSGGGTTVGGITVSPTLVVGSGLPRVPDPVGPNLPSRTVTFTPTQALANGETASWRLLRHGTSTQVATSTVNVFSYAFGPGDGGEYDVIRTVQPASGPAVDSPTVSFRINTAPIASFTSSGSGGAPRVVTFDSSGSHDPDGTITSYRWSFGFLDRWTSTNSNPSWTFTDPGTYTVVLAVVDNDGAQSATLYTFTVPGAPTARVAPAWDSWTLRWDAVPGASTYRVWLNYDCGSFSVAVDPASAPSYVAQTPTERCGAVGTVSATVEVGNSQGYGPISLPASRVG